MRIRIISGAVILAAELDDTPTARAVAAALPCEAAAHTWGDEVYFDLPADAELESNATDVVDPGAVCYWVQGKSLALPFGPTPASRGDECRLVTAVNVLGRLLDDPAALGAIRDGDSIRVERAD